MIEYQFGPWLPDQKDYKNPGLEECLNALPGNTGYQPAREPRGDGVTISGTIIGASSAFLKDASSLVFVATTVDLYVIRNGSATASSLSLTLDETDRVAFAQFGTAIYATTKNGSTWVLTDVETDNTFSAASGSPPAANAIGRVADFLVMGNLTDIDASDAPFRVRWSRYNDPSGAWTTDIASQSGAVDLDPQYGPITAITGETVGLIFQRQGISRFTYEGGASVFRRDTFEKNRGCIAPFSAVSIGEVTYYVAHDGFARTDGTTPRVISTGKVWKYFSDRIDQNRLDEIVGAIDLESRRVVWLCPGSGETGLTDQFWFNYETEQWGYAKQTLDWVVGAAKDGLTLEEVGALFPDLDAMPVSLDDPAFRASARSLKVFVNGELSELTGRTLGATFQTGDLQPFTGFRSYISEVHPVIELQAANVKIGVKDRMTQAFTQVGPVAMGAVGYAPVSADARYFRVIIDIPAGQEWRDAWGFQVNAIRAGVV